MSVMPVARGIVSSSDHDSAPSLRRMCPTWYSTVVAEMNSCERRQQFGDCHSRSDRRAAEPPWVSGSGALDDPVSNVPGLVVTSGHHRPPAAGYRQARFALCCIGSASTFSIELFARPVPA
jgi:hypothetical protein